MSERITNQGGIFGITRFPLQEIQRYMKTLLLGVEVMHDRQIAHKDLKPDNLLLDKNGDLKIGDFGMANQVFFMKKQPLV